jgi:hypothetical protein
VGERRVTDRPRHVVLFYSHRTADLLQWRLEKGQRPSYV